MYAVTSKRGTGGEREVRGEEGRGKREEGRKGRGEGRIMWLEKERTEPDHRQFLSLQIEHAWGC